MIEAAPITPEFDAGSRSLLDFYLSLRELGHETHFLFESEVNLREALSLLNPEVIFVSRPGLYQRTYSIYQHLNCKVIYIAQDLHFIRLSLQENLLGDLSPTAHKIMRQIEKFCILSSDLSIFPTRDEAHYANKLFKTNKAIPINYFRFEEVLSKNHSGVLRRLIFIGGSDHKPNQDGITWFINNVFKGIKIEFPKIQLFVVGRWDKEFQRLLQKKGIVFSGLLPELSLSTLINQCDIGIAPLRFGAGMKRKVLNYLAHGVPVISTTYGVQGISTAVSNGIELANTPKEWSYAVHKFSDLNFRQTQGTAGSEFIKKNFSFQRQKDDLIALLERVGNL